MIVRQVDNFDSEGVLVNRKLSTIRDVKSDEFIQVYLTDMSGMMNITSKGELRVLLHFWKYSTYVSDNQIGNMVTINSRIMADISNEMDVNVQSVRNIVVGLKKKGLIIADESCRGVYYLNPQYFFKGNSSDRLKCFSRTINYNIID